MYSRFQVQVNKGGEGKRQRKKKSDCVNWSINKWLGTWTHASEKAKGKDARAVACETICMCEDASQQSLFFSLWQLYFSILYSLIALYAICYVFFFFLILRLYIEIVSFRKLGLVFSLFLGVFCCGWCINWQRKRIKVFRDTQSCWNW